MSPEPGGAEPISTLLPLPFVIFSIIGRRHIPRTRLESDILTSHESDNASANSRSLPLETAGLRKASFLLYVIEDQLTLKLSSTFLLDLDHPSDKPIDRAMVAKTAIRRMEFMPIVLFASLNTVRGRLPIHPQSRLGQRNIFEH